MKKVILVDGNSLMYRGYYATAYSGNLMRNSKGLHTNCIYGFVNMINKLLKEDFSHFLIAFDTGKKTFRHEMYTEYKDGRSPTPNELIEQIPYVKEFCDKVGITRYEKDSFEADDIIGIFANKASLQGYKVDVYTGDKDLLQLINDDITVNITKKGVSELDVYTPSFLYERMSVSPNQITDLKGLMGDKSDNLPGIPGVGEKTAVKLLKEYGTLEGVLENKERITGKLGEKIRDNFEMGILCKRMATILTESELDIDLVDISYQGFVEEELMEFYKEVEFHSFMKRKTIKNEVSIKIISNDDIYEIEKYLESGSYVSVEVYEENYHQGTVLGISILNSKGCIYIPFDLIETSMTILPEWLADEKQIKYTYDYKKAKVALMWLGYDFNGVEFDILLASYVLNPNTKEDLMSICLTYDYEDVFSDEVIFGKGAKKHIPDNLTLANYSIKKLSAISALRENLLENLEEKDQLKLFHLEMDLCKTLANMEFEGVIVDTSELNILKTRFDSELDVLRKEIHALAGCEFNINSPKQLGKVLFEDLSLPVAKKTKTGYSTNVDVLNELKPYHPIIESILNYRTISKLVSTYIDGILKVLIEKDEIFRVHTIFKQALTSTGRLSSVEPNLQNIPIKTEIGRLIRKVFIPNKDNQLLGADYSQIELRVLADMSNTVTLIDAFNNELDIHKETAMKVFKVTSNEVTPLMRRQAKAVNFGIIYGQGAWGLANEIDISPIEAQKFIDDYYDSFPGIKNFLSETVENAKENGYAMTMMNRRRYLPDLYSSNGNIRAFGERTAKNAPIQGSAADIIKKAMVDIDKEMRRLKLKSKLLIQIHDELIFDVEESEKKIMEKLVLDIMKNTVNLKVPLEVDYGFGKNLYEIK